MSQEGMDQHWAEMTPAGRLRTIRNEVMIGYFESAREKWLYRLAGEPGIIEIVRQIMCAEQHQATAVRLLQELENAAERAEEEPCDHTDAGGLPTFSPYLVKRVDGTREEQCRRCGIIQQVKAEEKTNG